VIILALPAYNEEKALPLLLWRMHEVATSRFPGAYTVIVVNDGSSDGTADVARSWGRTLPLTLVNHQRNLGLGAAIHTALTQAAALAGPDDIVVTMDADNTHDPALIPTMCQEIQRGADIVIASRYQPGGREIGLSAPRRLFSRGASLLLRLFFPIPGVRDYTCGYRAYRGGFLQRALDHYGPRLIEEQGFTCMAEILIKMGRLGARVREVPLVLRYDRKEGPSKMKVARTIGRYLALIARQRF